jgi:HK97 family phage prohead protease
VLHKDVAVETKADGGAGEFVALASVFNNVDSVGDKMLPGSFSPTLARWRQKGDPIPVILSHNWDDPMAHIGTADPHDVIETERGLEVHGRLDIHDNPTAKQVYRLMKERRLTGWSFGYTIPEGGQQRRNGVNEISAVELIEVGPTLKGANSEAELQAVKTALRATYSPSDDTAFDPVMAIFDEANEQWRKDQELERLIEQVQTKAAENEKRKRPVQVRHFTV